MKRLLRNAPIDLPGEQDVRRVVGELSSFDLRDVSGIAVQFPEESATICEVTFWHSTGPAITLRMSRVQQLLLPEVTPYPLKFGELFISDVTARGLEGIAYEVDDRDASGFRCLCGALEVRVEPGHLRSPQSSPIS